MDTAAGLYPDAPACAPINRAVYGGAMQAMGLLEERLGLRINLTGNRQSLHEGDIFLFNHFTRFETAVPPYLIFRETGALCRTIAHHDLFEVSPYLSQFLKNMGAVPNNAPDVLPFLAAEVLRGRKVVIFPEGGMVKDKRVLDASGRYGVWSPSSHMWRKHHRGAFVLAQMVDILRLHLRRLITDGKTDDLNAWGASLGLTPEALAAQAARPTRIVGGSITFYPVRVGSNLLTQGLSRITGSLPAQALDELVIESNILFRRTDMDVHIADAFSLPPPPRAVRPLLARALKGVADTAGLFALTQPGPHHPALVAKVLEPWLEKATAHMRDATMERIYRATTLNLNHLTAAAVMRLVSRGEMNVTPDRFHKLLYLALKELQTTPGINLHCSLSWPEFYGGLLEGAPAGFTGFLQTCARAGLLRLPTHKLPDYRFSHALEDRLDFHEIRLENPIQVHANEAAPIPAMAAALELAEKQLKKLSPAALESRLATHLWDDEQRAAAWGRTRYNAGHKPGATPIGDPFLLLPPLPEGGKAKVGILLVHGFVSVPAQMRPLADFLHQHGYAVLGMRLPGHGTAPRDLERTTRAQWRQAVADNARILAAHAEKTIIIGNSCGAGLALQHAAGSPETVAAVVSMAAPLRITVLAMRFLPLVLAVNAVLKYTLGLLPGLYRLRKGLFRFYPNNSQEPLLNYAQMPVAAIAQLARLMREVKRALPRVTVPTLVVQGTADATVAPASAQTVHDAIPSPHKELLWLPGVDHALLRENNPQLWQHILAFIRTHTESEGHAT